MSVQPSFQCVEIDIDKILHLERKGLVMVPGTAGGLGVVSEVVNRSGIEFTKCYHQEGENGNSDLRLQRHHRGFPVPITKLPSLRLKIHVQLDSTDVRTESGTDRW